MRSYKSKQKAILIFIEEILHNYTDVNHRLSAREIQRKLRDYYDLDVAELSTITDNLKELEMCKEGMICCNRTSQEGRDGYTSGWYYKHHDYNNDINEMIDDILYLSEAPYSVKEKKIEILKSFKKQSAPSDTNEEIGETYRRPHFTEVGHENYKKISKILRYNRNNNDEIHITFNACYYDASDNKIDLTYLYFVDDVLPLAIVEHNYEFYCFYTSEKGGIASYRINLMGDLKENKCKKIRGNAKRKVLSTYATKDGLKRYIDEHQFDDIPFYTGITIDNKPQTFAIAIKENSECRFGLNFIVDEFGLDNIKNIEYTKLGDIVVKIKCSLFVLWKFYRRYLDRIYFPNRVIADAFRFELKILNEIENGIYLYAFPAIRVDILSDDKLDKNGIETLLCEIEIMNGDGWSVLQIERSYRKKDKRKKKSVHEYFAEALNNTGFVNFKISKNNSGWFIFSNEFFSKDLYKLFDEFINENNNFELVEKKKGLVQSFLSNSYTRYDSQIGVINRIKKRKKEIIPQEENPVVRKYENDEVVLI